MNFDLYFTVNERDLQDIDDYISDWAHMEDVDCEVDLRTDHSRVRLEDSLTDHNIASLEPCPLRTRVERSLMKPLPPIPEESKRNSRSASGSHEAPARSEVRPGLRLTPSPCHSAKNEIAYRTALQRRPRVSRMRQEGANDCRSGSTQGTASERSHATSSGHDLSSSPQNHSVKKQTVGLTCSQPLHIETTINSDYDSMHSPETSDLDRWASEMYGAHESTMTALREKRCRRPIDNTDSKHRDEPTPTIDRSHITKAKLDSFFGSDTSVSSFNDRECASSFNTTTPLADYPGRPLSDATEATSFFDFNDDEDDPKDKKSEDACEKRTPAQGVWRQLARSLRPARHKLPTSQARNSALPPIDVPMILT